MLNLACFSAKEAATLEPCLAALLPDMPAQMRADLLPLLRGNLERIAQVREQARRQDRMLDVEHREWMICLGRGFDFLHTPNLALIIGPYSPDLADPLRWAAAIIEGNMKAGRIPDDGFLLLASVPYDEIGVDRARAELKSRFLSCFAATAHYWSRKLQALGHTVRLMPPSYVKAYLKRSKNDANDAAAICEAVTRPSMRFIRQSTFAMAAGCGCHGGHPLCTPARHETAMA